MARARCEATLTGGAKQPSAVLTSQNNPEALFGRDWKGNVRPDGGP